MNHKYKLEDLTINVNDAVRVYICVHNDVLRETANLGNLTKTRTDRDVTLPELFELCESLLLLWNDIRRTANEYRDSTYASLSLDEKLYFDTLKRYVDSVRDSVVALVARQRLINEHGGAMKSKSFSGKEKEYQDTIQRHKSAESSLMYLTHTLRDGLVFGFRFEKE